jgi:pyrroloquinoline quinone (PQQ) biosynthesis protein C
MSSLITPETFSNNSVNAPVARQGAGTTDLHAYLESHVAKILEHRGVDHPFLNGYRAHRLRPEQERRLYLETYYYFQYVPFYICALCTQTRDEAVMRQILSNVADELGLSGTRPHSEIFLDFLGRLGIGAADIEAYRPLPSTTALNRGIQALYVSPPFVKALGALFAEETQSAAMVEKYHAGLEHQGHSEGARYFWQLHIRAEVGHSNAVYNCIFPYLQTAADRALFERGINEYMALLEVYWDGVQQLLGEPVA